MVTKTNILEERTANLETTVQQNEKFIREKSIQMSALEENVIGKLNKLQLEVRRHPSTMCMYPKHIEDRHDLYLGEINLITPIEFL